MVKQGLSAKNTPSQGEEKLGSSTSPAQGDTLPPSPCPTATSAKHDGRWDVPFYRRTLTLLRLKLSCKICGSNGAALGELVSGAIMGRCISSLCPPIPLTVLDGYIRREFAKIFQQDEDFFSPYIPGYLADGVVDSSDHSVDEMEVLPDSWLYWVDIDPDLSNDTKETFSDSSIDEMEASDANMDISCNPSIGELKIFLGSPADEIEAHPDLSVNEAKVFLDSSVDEIETCSDLLASEAEIFPGSQVDKPDELSSNLLIDEVNIFPSLQSDKPDELSSNLLIDKPVIPLNPPIDEMEISPDSSVDEIETCSDPSVDEAKFFPGLQSDKADKFPLLFLNDETDDFPSSPLTGKADKFPFNLLNDEADGFPSNPLVETAIRSNLPVKPDKFPFNLLNDEADDFSSILPVKADKFPFNPSAKTVISSNPLVETVIPSNLLVKTAVPSNIGIRKRKIPPDSSAGETKGSPDTSIIGDDSITLRDCDTASTLLSLETSNEELDCLKCSGREMQSDGHVGSAQKDLQLGCQNCRRTLETGWHNPVSPTNFDNLLANRTGGSSFIQYLPSPLSLQPASWPSVNVLEPVTQAEPFSSHQPKPGYQAALDHSPVPGHVTHSEAGQPSKLSYPFDWLYVQGIPRCPLGVLRNRLIGYGIRSKWVREISFLEDRGKVVTELLVFVEKKRAIAQLLCWNPTRNAPRFKILPGYDVMARESCSTATIVKLKGVVERYGRLAEHHRNSGGKVTSRMFEDRRAQAEARLATMRKTLLTGPTHAISQLNNRQMTVTFCTWNCQGLGGKEEQIEEFLRDKSVDILFLCETWTDPGVLIEHPGCHYSSSFPPPEERHGRNNNGIALYSWQEDIGLRILFEDPGLTLIFEAFGVLLYCVYLSPSLNEDARFERIFGSHANIFWSSNKPRILMGDLNMRLKSLTGDTAKSNSRLHEALVRRGLNLRNTSELPPTFSSHSGKSTPDLIYCSGDLINEADVISVDMDTDLGCSDHRPLLLTLDWAGRSFSRVNDMLARPIWRLSKLRDPQKSTGYRLAVEDHFSRLLPLLDDSTDVDDPQAFVDRIYNQFIDCISHAADSSIGRKNTFRNGRSLKLTSPDLRNLRRRRREAWRNYVWIRDLQIDHLLDASQVTYRQLTKEARRATIKLKRQGWSEYCARLVQANNSELIKQVRYLKNGEKTRMNGGVHIRSKLSTTPSNLEAYRQYFEGQFQRQHWQPVPAEATWIETDGASSNEIQEILGLIDETAVSEALSRIPRGKSPGVSGLRTELLQFGGPVVVTFLVKLFRLCAQQQTVPAMWRTALLSPVFKEGDPKLISNYRPVSLLEVPRKVFERLLLDKWLVQKIEPLSIVQGGFRSGRSALDQAACLNEAIQRFQKEHDHIPITTYLDIKAAYDSMDREILWKILRTRNIGSIGERLLRAMYDNCSSRVVLGRSVSGDLSHPMGVMQGSVISPSLYSLFLDGISREMEGLSSVSFGNQPASMFLYADDIAILAKDNALMQAILARLEAFAVRMNFRFSPSKCVVVGASDEQLSLYGQPLRVESSFKYLGVIFNAKGIDPKLHIQHLVGKSRQASYLLLSNEMRRLSFSDAVERRVFTVFVRSAMEYGLVLLRPTASLCVPLQRRQNGILRGMARVPTNTSTAALHQHYGIPMIKHRAESLQARWLLHGHFAQPDTMLKAAINSRTQRNIPSSALRPLESNPILRIASIKDGDTWLDAQLSLKKAQEIEHVADFARWSGGNKKAGSQSSSQAQSQTQAQAQSPSQSPLQSPPRSRSQFQAQPQTWAIEPFASVKQAKSRLASFSAAPLTRPRRCLLRRWILRRCGYGELEVCRRCGVENLTVYHVQACTGINVDLLCRSRQWLQAAQAVYRVLALTAPHRSRYYSASRLRRGTPTRPLEPDDWGGGDGEFDLGLTD